MTRSRNGSEKSEESTVPAPATGTRQSGLGRHRPSQRSLRSVLGRAAGHLATLVTVTAAIVCVVLALHIAFVVFSANQGNSLVKTVNEWAEWLAWQFRDIFTPKDERVGVLVNYGIAAVVYLIAGRTLAGLIRRMS